MSEQHQASPQSSADPGAAMVDAYVSGDKEGAQRFLDERNARDGVGQGGGENNAPVAFPESAPTEQVDFAAEQMRGQPDGEQWIARLGGVGTQDMAQNVSLARAFVHERITSEAPRLVDFLSGHYELEDGTTYSPGDDPALIFYIAELERLLRARGGDALPAPFQTMREVKMNGNQPQQRQQPSNAASVDERIDELTQEMHNAFSRGDKLKAKRLDAERSRLSASVYGDGPIVGSGGRNA